MQILAFYGFSVTEEGIQTIADSCQDLKGPSGDPLNLITCHFFL